MLKIARHLKMHSTRLSQALHGTVELSLEQACGLAEYFSLSALETEFLLALVQRERAGTPGLKRAIDSQLRSIRERARDLSQRIERDKQLSEQDKPIFYSSWHYSAVRLLTSIPKYQDPDAIARYFKMSPKKLSGILQFLVDTGLCIEENGKFEMGPKRTHLDAQSLLINRHRANWRLKSIEAHEDLKPTDLAFTGPMSIGTKEKEQIRKELLELIERVLKYAVDSEADQVACLNIDWFQF
jgi:uncharacterized protein (TIGR02147 family)